MPTGEQILIAVLNGITWGLIIALIALGLNLIFGLLEVVNLAHGSLYMLGAVGGWFVIGATGSFLVAAVVAPLAVGFLGMVIERVALRPIEEDIPTTLIATFALLIVLDQIGLLVFGPGTRSVSAPIQGSVTLAGITYPLYRLSVAVVSLGLMGALYLFLHRTRYGMWMRGVRQDLEMASALGIPRSQVYVVTFGLGAGLAALAGVLLSPIVGVNHLMGLDILAVAFIVVIVGGLGSLKGVLVASLVYALVENIGTLYITTVDARVLTLSLMIAFVIVRPDGLFEEGLG
jgi:branched-chain amino acid transport system permease protein